MNGSVVTSDLSLLRQFGRVLDSRVLDSRLRQYPQDHGALAIPAATRDVLISHLLKIRSKTKGLITFELNRAQREYSRRCSRRNIVLKARQLGITSYVAARYFIQTIVRPGTMTVQVAHNQESAEEIFRIVHRFWENLPEGMRKGVLLPSHSNVRQMVFPAIDSEYRVATADDNAGRGLTIQNLHCSEVARWSRGGVEALASLRAGVPPDGDIVLESTPNGAGGVFYEEWQRAEETGYTKHFFPWWYEECYSGDLEKISLYPLTPQEQELVDRYGLTERQIAWRRVNRAQLRGLAAQEYAEDAVSCFRASGDCLFDTEMVEEILEGTTEPIVVRDNRQLMVWFPARPGHQYIIGVDPAGGGSDGDYACAQIIDRDTGMHCAELHGHFPPRELASKVAALGQEYNAALVAVERNNHGYGVLANLRAEDYPNIYSQKEQDGWLTSAASRPGMLENLAAVLATEPTLFHSPRFLNECRTFVRRADGSAAAAAGAHDDCVMAMAVAFAVRQAVAGTHTRSPKLELASVVF